MKVKTLALMADMVIWVVLFILVVANTIRWSKHDDRHFDLARGIALGMGNQVESKWVDKDGNWEYTTAAGEIPIYQKSAPTTTTATEPVAPEPMQHIVRFDIHYDDDGRIVALRDPNYRPYVIPVHDALTTITIDVGAWPGAIEVSARGKDGYVLVRRGDIDRLAETVSDVHSPFVTVYRCEHTTRGFTIDCRTCVLQRQKDEEAVANAMEILQAYIDALTTPEDEHTTSADPFYIRDSETMDQWVIERGEDEHVCGRPAEIFPRIEYYRPSRSASDLIFPIH